MHLTTYFSWALAVFAIYPSAIVCMTDETMTRSDITQKDAETSTAAETTPAKSEQSSSPYLSSPTSSVESSNSTVATATTSAPPRPVTTAVEVTPTTAVPDLVSGANGKEVEFITSLFGLLVAFIV